MITIDEYINKYTMLCEKTQELKSRAQTREHNNAEKQLRLLYFSIEQDRELCVSLFPKLLKGDSEKVRLSAAIDCLATKIFVEEALQELSRITVDSCNGNCRMTASIVLKLWSERGYIER